MTNREWAELATASIANWFDSNRAEDRRAVTDLLQQTFTDHARQIREEFWADSD